MAYYHEYRMRDWRQSDKRLAQSTQSYAPGESNAVINTSTSSPVSYSDFFNSSNDSSSSAKTTSIFDGSLEPIEISGIPIDRREKTSSPVVRVGRTKPKEIKPNEAFNYDKSFSPKFIIQQVEKEDIENNSGLTGESDIDYSKLWKGVGMSSKLLQILGQSEELSYTQAQLEEQKFNNDVNTNIQHFNLLAEANSRVGDIAANAGKQGILSHTTTLDQQQVSQDLAVEMGILDYNRRRANDSFEEQWKQVRRQHQYNTISSVISAAGSIGGTFYKK